ncbi:dihydrolipoamide acetyltransferase family protein [Polymorphum gilvum]|uniref:Dihydrolipoamide acetyltransferase component of pyruvate dehydrogenase complex n=1 Tax=Polymorphum gilvum (strain LMG 25793 / CGMCC 1.9160 / SL003B-26A1) TaxID=991905 RepID=F2IYM0_POLGS|nr:dihydrolipoamide acetyltransferase family protein [Polymorphum gilvum]ADZ69467.1 2-oxoglutarate dehydrogenase, E2 component, dihydrolipoamide succinyltransferase [Polymorphum gilvum SL003B-26A1]
MEVLMPQLGETVTEGTISTWFKSEGDAVAAGDVLFEIETEKVAMEVQAIESGTLTRVLVQAGETVAVGTTVAMIGEQAALTGGNPGLADPAGSNPSSGNPGPGAMNGAAPAPEGFGPYSEVRTPTERFGSRHMAGGLRISPLARRIAAQQGIDVAGLARDLAAAGRRKILRDDVLGYAERQKQSPAAAAPRPATVEARPMPARASLPAGGDYDLVPLNRIRRRTAEHLARSWTDVPHVAQAVEVDFQAVDKARRRLNDAHAAAWGFRLTYLPFIARAVCLAIREFPRVNASIDGDALRVHRRVNLGIAVDLDHDGLMVPVVHGAEDLNLAGLARAMKDRIDRARAGKLTADDLTGGTYSLSNSGTFGTLFTAPIVNAPEVAILSTDGIRKRPVVIEGEDEDRIAIRPVGVLAQSFDHRAFDGAYSAAFLHRVRTILESRDWMSETG